MVRPHPNEMDTYEVQERPTSLCATPGVCRAWVRLQEASDHSRKILISRDLISPSALRHIYHVCMDPILPGWKDQPRSVTTLPTYGLPRLDRDVPRRHGLHW